jgi:hypothetical protein
MKYAQKDIIKLQQQKFSRGNKLKDIGSEKGIETQNIQTDKNILLFC